MVVCAVREGLPDFITVTPLKGYVGVCMPYMLAVSMGV